jgi:hypothetical protein
MTQNRIRSFWKYGQGLCFSPRVKPIGKHWDPFFERWSIVCRVTGRDAAHKYHGYRTGDEIMTNPASLKAECRIIPGTFGRLAYYDGITTAEIDSLPTLRVLSAA